MPTSSRQVVLRLALIGAAIIAIPLVSCQAAESTDVVSKNTTLHRDAFHFLHSYEATGRYARAGKGRLGASDDGYSVGASSPGRVAAIQ